MPYMPLLYTVLIVAIVVGATLWFMPGINGTIQKVLIAIPVVLFLVWLALLLAWAMGVGGPYPSRP